MLHFSMFLCALLSFFPIDLKQRQVNKRHCAAVELAVPSYAGTIDLSGLVSCGAGAAGPWSGAFTPDGQFAYFALGGDPFDNNCLIAKVNLQSNAVVKTIAVGLFPEEIVITQNSSGQMDKLYATNSSSGTISVIDANDNVIDTISIPDPFGFGSFPFALIQHPVLNRLYVGTLDGSGAIYVIDTSSNQLNLDETIVVPGGATFGRMAFADNETLIVTGTVFDFLNNRFRAEVYFINPQLPTTIQTILLDMSGGFVSPQDVAIGCGGLTYVAGFNLHAVYVLDAHVKALQNVFPITDSSVQGIGLSAKGLLFVADQVGNELTVYNALKEQALFMQDLAFDFPNFHAGPLEILMHPDGSKAYIPCNQSDNIAVFNLP